MTDPAITMHVYLDAPLPRVEATAGEHVVTTEDRSVHSAVAHALDALFAAELKETPCAACTSKTSKP